MFKISISNMNLRSKSKVKKCDLRLLNLIELKFMKKKSRAISVSPKDLEVSKKVPLVLALTELTVVLKGKLTTSSTRTNQNDKLKDFSTIEVKFSNIL